VSNFLSLNTALSGLRAAQLAMDTVANNIANANTAGYTRQRVMQAATTPFLHPAGTVGTGVQITDITRIRDGFLDARLRTTAATLGYQDTLAALLQRTEGVMGEPDSGLSVQLAAVWDAFDDLALDPADPSTRRQVLAALEGLAATFRQVDNGWSQLATDTEVRLGVAADEVNGKLERLAKLNELIPSAAFRGTTPTDLMDERDRLLDDLSVSLGVQVTERNDPSGAKIVDVSLGGVELVSGKHAGALSVAAGGAVTLTGHDGSSASLASVQEGADGVGGDIGALHHFLAVDLPGRREDLTHLAQAIAVVLNSAHGEAYDLDGLPGGQLLDLGTPPGAGTVRVVLTEPRKLGAASTATGGIHDGTAAAAMAELRYQRFPSLPGDASYDAALGLGGQDQTGVARTLDDRLRALITTLARATFDTTSAADAAEAVYTSARVARQSVHGVSIDEEMADLVKYQRALEAASRVMSAIDEALDVLVNRTGIVGR
jgi:flagellar hook-associated protein 1